MLPGAGDRGVSEVIGFILVFGMLVTAFTVYQGIVVPDQNRQVEFAHNQDVQGDLQNLRNAIVNTAAAGSSEAVSITPGATYPRRTIASNLGVSSGAVSTRSLGSTGIRIDNVRAQNPETRDYIDSAANGPFGPFETKAIHYTPVYSFYSNAPETVYENTIAYNQFATTNLTLTDQVLVDDRRITLIAVNGSLSRAQRDTVSFSTKAISTSSNRVSIRNTTGQHVTITVPTRLSATKWEKILDEEMGPDGFVEQVDPVPGEDAVELVMRQGETYELRMAKIGVGDVTSDEEAGYLTTRDGTTHIVNVGGQTDLTVEVRDRYNNPVSNVDVTADDSSLDGEIDGPNTRNTDSSGQATFTYSASGVTAGTTDTFDLSFGDESDARTVPMTINVVGTGGVGSSSNYDLEWDTDAIESDADDEIESCSGNTCTYNRSKDSDDELDLPIGTDPEFSGVFIDYSINDDEIITKLKPSEGRSDSNGRNSTTATIGSTGTVEIRASAIEGSDTLTLEVSGGSDGVRGGSGSQVSYVDGSGSAARAGPESRVDFDISNDGSDSVTISHITIDSQDGSLVSIMEDRGGSNAPGQHEVYIDASTPGILESDGTPYYADIGDNEYQIGTVATLTEPATLSAGERAQITAIHFRDPEGQEVSVADKPLTVTLHYQDGTSTSFSFTPPGN